MPNSVLLISHFENRYKRLAKKFTSLEREVDALINNLVETPTLGESLGAGLYKIRLAVKSKGKSKSGGFHIITYLVTESAEETDIYLITIYDKSEESSINKDVLLKMVNASLDQ